MTRYRECLAAGSRWAFISIAVLMQLTACGEAQSEKSRALGSDVAPPSSGEKASNAEPQPQGGASGETPHVQGTPLTRGKPELEPTQPATAGGSGGFGGSGASAGDASSESVGGAGAGGSNHPVQSCCEGCSCETGVPRETMCTDLEDNDGDGKVSCQDIDCAGQVCRPGSLEAPYRSRATRDVSEYGTNEGLLQDDGQPSFAIAANPRGEKAAVLEFGDIPSDPAISVRKATLWIYAEVGGKPLRIFDADGSEFDSPEPEALAGPRAFDVTEIVTAWVNSRESRRVIRLRYGSSFGSVFIRATEHEQAEHAPHIEIFYEALCDPNGKCPLPSMSEGSNE